MIHLEFICDLLCEAQKELYLVPNSDTFGESFIQKSIIAPITSDAIFIHTKIHTYLDPFLCFLLSVVRPFAHSWAKITLF
jgi:hypothetical protein